MSSTLVSRNLFNQREDEAREKAALEKAEEKKKKEDADYKELLKKRKDDVLKRQDLRNRAVNGLPARSADGGTMGKAAHLSSLNAEGVAAEMVVDAFIFAIQFLFNTSYMAQTSHYVQGMLKEHADSQKLYVPKAGVWPTVYELDESGKSTATPVDRAVREPTKTEIHMSGFIHPDEFVPLIYRKNVNGKYPIVYMVDESTGTIDYEQPPYAEGKAPVFAIRANGYIPVPSYTQGWADAVSAQLERMMGSDWLSPKKRLELYGYLDQQANTEKKSDLLSDRMIAQRGAQAAPAAKPR